MRTISSNRLASACLLLVLIGTAIVIGVPQFRWRVRVILLSITGQVPDLPLHDIILFMLPHSEQSIARLIDTHNPYAVIRNPRSSAADVDEGGRLFRSECAVCHAPDGTGSATAPALFGREFKHGASDWAIFRTIRYGVTNTAMVAHPSHETQLWQLVAYIRSLEAFRRPSGQTSSVDPSRIFSAVSYEELRAIGGPSNDWLTYSGSYSSIRHSALKQFDPSNVDHLAVRWIYQFPGRPVTIEASPLVRQGVMFVTSPPARAMALDAATGRLLWSYEHALPGDAVGGQAGIQNRGMAILGDKVFLGTGDAHLVALSAKTGALLWKTEVANYKDGFCITGAPLAYRDLVVTGVCTRHILRGFIAAYDANTGKERWRFYTIPRPGEAGNDTWAGDSWRNGGGPTWMTGSYDAQEDLLYWGVGNPKPDYDPAARRGDNLYTNSVVALRGSNGKLVWYFQFTPADDHDWDAAQIPILADATTGHGPEKRLLWANRNGFYYVLNRVSGRFLTATSFAKTTWADGVDAKGRPLLHIDSSPLHKGVVIYPGNTGATNWWSPSFDPAANRIFVPVIEQGMVYFPSERTGADNMSSAENWPTGLGMSLYTAVRALDASTGKLVWEYRRAPRANDNAIAGLLSTESGVLFGGDQSTLFALNSQTGTLLWSFATGGKIVAAPVTYSVKGQQFVVIAAGSDLLAFALKDARSASKLPR
jgi:alcohol dehydrogenase (cytochrome c)